MFVYGIWVAHDDPLASLCSYLEEHLPFIKVVAREEGGEKKERKRRRKRERGRGIHLQQTDAQQSHFQRGEQSIGSASQTSSLLCFVLFLKKEKQT